MNSVETRFPFLNLQLIHAVHQLDFSLLADFTQPRGEGDKTLLREIAKDEGFTAVADFAKKAMQFGTGIAKLSNVAKFGSNRAAKGEAKYEID